MYISTPLINAQCQSMSINADQYQSTFWNWSEFLSMSIIDDQCQIRHYPPTPPEWENHVLGSIPEFWSALISIDPQWALIEGVLIYECKRCMIDMMMMVHGTWLIIFYTHEYVFECKRCMIDMMMVHGVWLYRTRLSFIYLTLYFIKAI